MDDIIGFIQGFAHGDQLILVLMAVVIVVITAIASHLATKLVKRMMQVDGLPLPSSSILVNIVRSVIWVVGLSIMLSACFGVDVNALLAALGIGGVALSLGMQDTVKKSGRGSRTA